MNLPVNSKIIYKIKQITLLLTFFVFFSNGYCQSVLINGNQSQTFTIEDIFKTNTIVLMGRNPSYNFYVPLPLQWSMHNLQLNLIVQFSRVLLPSSTLTLMVEEVPIDTIKLDNTKEQPLLWKVTIPQQYLKKKQVTLRIVGYMKISEDICQDIENQGNWVTVAGSSSFIYSYQAGTVPLQLSNFPYPFIQTDSPKVDKINFLIPDKPSLENFGPYLMFAHSIIKKASWRGVQIGIHKLNALGSEERNAILIGTPGTINFSKFPLAYPFTLKNNQWVDDQGSPLPEGDGFILLSKNPNRPDKALLTISANSKDGIENVLRKLNTNEIQLTSIDPAYYIARSATPDLQVVPQITTTFHDLGYTDNVVFGDGQQKLAFQFVVPGEYSYSPAKLVLIYSNSPFLDKDTSSYIMVSLNGFPLEGARLQSTSAQKNYLQLELPKKLLKPGKNSLEVTFDLRLPEKYCSRNHLSQSWGTIYENSYITFSKENRPQVLQLKFYPYFLTDRVLVALPNDDNFYQDEPFLLQLIRFAGSLKSADSLLVVNNQAVDELNQTGDLVYFGAGEDRSKPLRDLQATIEQMVSNLNLTSNKALQSINKDLFVNAFKKDQDVGFVGLLNPTMALNKTELVLYGYSFNELFLALTLLNDSYKLESLSGNLAVTFINGTFTNLASGDIQHQVEKEVQLEGSGRFTLKAIIFGLGGLIIFLILFFGIRSIRNK